MTRTTGWSPEEEEELEPVEASEAEDQSTLQLIRFLFAEGREYAETEIERQKLRASLVGAAARDAAILGFIALFLLLGMLVALIVGCLWVLAPYVGPLAAMAIILVLCSLTILLLLLGVRARVRSAVRYISNGKEQS